MAPKKNGKRGGAAGAAQAANGNASTGSAAASAQPAGQPAPAPLTGIFAMKPREEDRNKAKGNLWVGLERARLGRKWTTCPCPCCWHLANLTLSLSVVSTHHVIYFITPSSRHSPLPPHPPTPFTANPSSSPSSPQLSPKTPRNSSQPSTTNSPTSKHLYSPHQTI